MRRKKVEKRETDRLHGGLTKLLERRRQLEVWPGKHQNNVARQVEHLSVLDVVIGIVKQSIENKKAKSPKRILSKRRR